MFNSNYIQCILYQLLFRLSMIHYRYLCRIFERKCSLNDVFSLVEVDQVNVKYVSRATQSRFFVNYVTNTNQIDKNRMQYQGLDNERAKHVSNLFLCENNSNLHQQNPHWWCFLCPLPPFCFAQKIHCIWSGSYSVIIEALQHTSSTNQEKGHSASLLSHVQPQQAGLDKQFLESKILSTCLNIRWCSK